MNAPRHLLACLAALILLTSCANYGSEKHFERNSAAVDASKTLERQPDRATVYFFRQRAFMQPLIYVPIPPFFYAVDGTMMSIMPLGSHAVLSLEPGRHTFTRFIVSGGGLLPITLDRVDTELTVVAGQTYFVGSRNGFPSSPFEPVDSDRGRAITAETELARLIHQPVSTDTFASRMAAAEARRRAGSSTQASSQPLPQATAANFQNALPSSQQVGEFLEIVATVALVAVLLFGVAAGASSSPASPPPPSLNLSPPPAISTNSSVQQTRLDEPWKTSSGSLSEILRSKEETTLHNLSTGVRYRIADGRINGTDGSRYRVVGSTVFSDTGQSYQVIGNNVFASDGSSCVKTGVVVSCR